MLKTIQSFNGHDINSNQYKVIAHNFNTLPAANPIFIPEAQADSVDSGAWTVEVRTNTITFQIMDYPNRHKLADQLRVWFKRGTSGDLVATFHDDDVADLDYQLTERVVNLIEDPNYPLLYTAVLKSGQTAWRAVTPDTATTWSPTGSGVNTRTITPAGTDETRLNVTLEAVTSPPDTYLYQTLYQLTNPLKALGPESRAFCIEVDRTSLIAAGKLQNNCNDLRLFNAKTKLEINRWVAFPNPSTVKVWFNLSLSAGHALTLNSGVAQVETATAAGTVGAGGGTVDVTVTATALGSPQTISVPVADGDTAATWAGKVRDALDEDVDIKAFFDVTGSGVEIMLRRNASAANDTTLNIALANGSGTTGIVAAPTSANTTAGVRPSIPDSGTVDTLDFEVNQATEISIKGLPTGKGITFVMAHDGEWFVCRRVGGAKVYKLAVLQRGAFGTTQKEHNGGDVFWFVEYPLIMYYGNNASTNPTLQDGYNTTKPIFSLADSDNGQVSYTASSLFSGPSGKPGIWTPIRQKKSGPPLVNSNFYTKKENNTSNEPALGARSAAYQTSSKTWLSEDVIVGWQIQDPRGIEKITCTGRKYRTTNATWPAAKLQCRSGASDPWQTVFTEAAPGSFNTYVSLSSHADVPIPDNATILRFIFDGFSPSKANTFALLEAWTFKIDWVDTSIPQIESLGEQSNYQLHVRVKNNATLGNVTIEDSIELRYPMRIGAELILDGENFEATYDGINAHGAITLDENSRTVWLRLLPGVVNTVSIESITKNPDPGIGTMHASLSYYRRRL